MNGRHQPPKRSDARDSQLAGRGWMRRATGNRPRLTLLVATVVGLGAIATGSSLAALSSSSSSSQNGHRVSAGDGSTAGTARSPQPTPPAASSTTGPNVTSAGIAKTALQYPPRLKDQILRWKAGRGGAAWSAVTAQLGNVTQASGMRLYTQLQLECASLESSVQTARSAPPIPDEVMQRSYARVLAGLSSTAPDCRNAISVHSEGDEGQRIDVNKVLLNRSLAHFAAESKELYTATAEIRTLRR
jgi:hypothetical protein